jgi:hypothetical protein
VVELEAQTQQQPTLEDAAGDAGVAHCAEEDRVVLPDLGQRGVRQRLAGGMPAARPEVVLRRLDRGDAVHRGAQDLEALGNDLRTDAVTGKNGEVDRLRHGT